MISRVKMFVSILVNQVILFIKVLNSILNDRIVSERTWSAVIRFVLIPYAKLVKPYITYSDIKHSEAKSWEISDAEIFSLERPNCASDVPDEIENIIGVYDLEAPYLLECNDIVVSGETGAKYKSKKLILFDYHSKNRKFLDRMYAVKVRKHIMDSTYPVAKSEADCDFTIHSPALSLLGPFVSNYTHWTQEYLILLEAIEYYHSSTNSLPIIIISENSPTYVKQSLNHLGYPDSYIIEIQQETVLLKKCLLPSKRRQYSGRKQTAWVRENNSFNWLRAKATDALDNSVDVSKSKKIFISREDSKYRRIQNRSEVVEHLANLGFEKYILSDLTFKQQVDLFSDAEIIVGAHGSGLINAIYSHDSLVVELFADRYTAAIYEICTNLGNDYVCIECDPEGRDLRITTEQLDKVSRILRRRDE